MPDQPPESAPVTTDNGDGTQTIHVSAVIHATAAHDTSSASEEETA